MKKQVIIDYNEYLEMEQELEELKQLIIKIAFSNKLIDDELLEEIRKKNKQYYWWV